MDPLNDKKISPIRTYEGDVANALKHGNTSVISIAVSEQKAKLAKEQMVQNTPQTFSRFGIPKTANVSVDPSMYAGAPTVEPSQTNLEEFVKKDETMVTMPKEGIKVMPKVSPVDIPKVHTYINNANPALKDLGNRAPEEVKIKTPFPWKNIFFVILGMILIGGGGYGLYYIYKNKKPSGSGVKITNLENIISIIPTSNHIKIVVSTSTKPIVSALSKAVSESSGNDGTITDVFFRYSNDIRDGGSDITAKDFVKLSDLKIPDSLFRILKNPFMFGYHKISGINYPFVILKVDFFQGALSSMLRYESSIIDDFWPFIVKEGGSDTKSNISFGDKIIKNKDTRILKNVFSDKTLLLYSFIDSETLVITTSENSFIYLINEISRQKFVR
ncbi:MAG: hypothetical protein Q7R78_02230 [bacterium]|nr:hypothetical protein [bacterium]